MKKKEAVKLLSQYQCEFNRALEENFAQTLSENDLVRLFFINENQTFTDGRNIIVDPANDDLYFDSEALGHTEKFLKWPVCVSNNPWDALRLITRSLNIHESLHVLYTDFPPRFVNNPKYQTGNEITTISTISNIIEDAYIEAAGCSCYDNMEMFLKFARVSRLFASNPSEGTVARAFAKEGQAVASEEVQNLPLLRFINYMITFLLYPMLQQDPPEDDIADYVSQTRTLFLDGSAAAAPAERFAFSSRIYDIIQSLIPDDSVVLPMEEFKLLLIDPETHSGKALCIADFSHSGKVQAVTTRLFANLDNSLRSGQDDSEQLALTLDEYNKDKQAALTIVEYAGSRTVTLGSNYDCAVMHKDIKIIETKPRINLNLKKAYQNLYNKYRLNINSYSSRFSNLLKARVPVREENFLFGSAITSSRLDDVKKRYWNRRVLETDIPDLAILLLIDGSGSMRGKRRDSAMTSAVILHEVLTKQNMSHAVVEHRALGEEPAIEINILTDFQARPEEKYNIMQIDAYNDNRDGLALFWAERYIQQHSHCENNLIIIISDGAPAHAADDYYPPASIKDTANAVAKITRRGTNIIAIALDEPGCTECYDDLKEIYPDIVACDNLNHLTAQLLALISRQLR